MTTTPAHLRAEKSDRGFGYLPAVPSNYGGTVQVSESSAASGPYVWLRATAPVNLNDPAGPSVEAPMHLTVVDAWKLADQLRHLVLNHYQLRDTHEAGMWESAARGWLALAGATGDDEPRFVTTETGREHVAEMGQEMRPDES